MTMEVRVMKLAKRLAPAVASLVAFFLFAGAAATTTGTKVKSAGGPLNAVAMDGPSWPTTWVTPSC